MCIEEKLMEEIELSPESREFLIAAHKLGGKIREASTRLGYGLPAACQLVQDGNLTVHLHQPDESGVMGFVGLPVEVGLYLTSNACGGLFPQPPTTSGKES